MGGFFFVHAELMNVKSSIVNLPCNLPELIIISQCAFIMVYLNGVKVVYDRETFVSTNNHNCRDIPVTGAGGFWFPELLKA